MLAPPLCRASSRGEGREPGPGDDLAADLLAGGPAGQRFHLHPGTGGVDVLHYLVAYEVGRAVNPTLVEGQLRGGVAQGVGGALLEQFRYDESGQPQATTFMDYLMPTASEVPAVDLVVCEDSPATTNPLGVRGAGEGGLTGAGAAIASAVSDATGVTSIGELPITPGAVIGYLRRGAPT